MYVCMYVCMYISICMSGKGDRLACCNANVSWLQVLSDVTSSKETSCMIAANRNQSLEVKIVQNACITNRYNKMSLSLYL